MIMAKKKAAATVDLKKVSVRELRGLTTEDIADLRALGLGSVGAVMDAMNTHGGDLTKVSTPAVIISDQQSDRIGDAVLAHKGVPKKFAEKFEPSSGKSSSTEPSEEEAEEEELSAGQEFWRGVTDVLPFLGSEKRG